LERTVTRFPTYSSAWALLSLTYLDELRFSYRINADAAPPLDRALEAAHRAVELDPENARGLQAQMTALFFKREVDAALKVGAQGITINPNGSELVAEYGLRLALSGEWKGGAELIESVLDSNRGPLGYYETALALSFYMQRDYRTAGTWIRKASMGANPVYHVVAAAIFGQSGEIAAAAVEREWLIKNALQLVQDIDRELAVRNIRVDDQAHFIEGLRKAGLTIAGF
jgi:tetratricopeptide (TPR) repeat protein